MSRAFWLTLVAACAHDATPASSPSPTCTLVTTEAQVASCIGMPVTLDGVVARSKVPTLLGVDVDAPDLAGQHAQATGTLEEYVEPAPAPGEPIAARRGPGRYVRLVVNGALAVAKPR